MMSVAEVVEDGAAWRTFWLRLTCFSSKGISEDISRGSKGDIILESGDNGGLDDVLLRGRVVVFCIFLRNILPLGVETFSAEGGLGLPVAALPVDVTVGTGSILGEDEAIKVCLVGSMSHNA